MAGTYPSERELMAQTQGVPLEPAPALPMLPDPLQALLQPQQMPVPPQATMEPQQTMLTLEELPPFIQQQIMEWRAAQQAPPAVPARTPGAPSAAVPGMPPRLRVREVFAPSGLT